MSFGEILYNMMYEMLSPFGMDDSVYDRQAWALFPFGDLTDSDRTRIQSAFEGVLQEIVDYISNTVGTIANLMENGKWKSGNESLIRLLSRLAESIDGTYDSTAGSFVFNADGSTVNDVFPFVAVATVSKYLINGSTLSAIGDAIRAKEGTTEKYSPAAMEQKITDDLVKPSGTLPIKNAQQVDVSRYQYAKVTDANLIAENIKKDVTILGVTGTHEGASTPNLQSKSVTYTANGTATITPDDGYDGLSSVDVTVNVSGGGGGEDTVTVTLPIGPKKFNYDMEVTATYTNALGEIVANVPAGKPASYTVKKGSIFFIYGYMESLASISSPSLYGAAGNHSTDPRFVSNNKTGVFFVCDSDVTVVY